MKLRINNRKNIVKINRRRLGRSIEETDKKIETREEFEHWEIDTVEALKDKKRKCSNNSPDSMLITFTKLGGILNLNNFCIH